MCAVVCFVVCVCVCACAARRTRHTSSPRTRALTTLCTAPTAHVGHTGLPFFSRGRAFEICLLHTAQITHSGCQCFLSCVVCRASCRVCAVKIRMQVQGTLPPENRKPAAQIVKELGVRGLYKVRRVMPTHARVRWCVCGGACACAACGVCRTTRSCTAARAQRNAYRVRP